MLKPRGCPAACENLPVSVATAHRLAQQRRPGSARLGGRSPLPSALPPLHLSSPVLCLNAARPRLLLSLTLYACAATLAASQHAGRAGREVPRLRQGTTLQGAGVSVVAAHRGGGADLHQQPAAPARRSGGGPQRGAEGAAHGPEGVVVRWGGEGGAPWLSGGGKPVLKGAKFDSDCNLIHAWGS